MTDIEKMIEEIRKLYSNIAYEEIDAHLVFLCHPDTIKIIDVALQEAGIKLREDYIHFYESNYYEPGDVYMVSDRKIKRKILKQHGIKVQGDEYVIYKTYYNYDVSGSRIDTTISYSTRTNGDGLYTWR
jgi:hypothetical protein